MLSQAVTEITDSGKLFGPVVEDGSKEKLDSHASNCEIITFLLGNVFKTCLDELLYSDVGTRDNSVCIKLKSDSDKGTKPPAAADEAFMHSFIHSFISG